jgi:hypothetical protein
MRSCLFALVLGLLTVGWTATPTRAAARDNDHQVGASAQTVPVLWRGGFYRGFYPRYNYYPYTYGYRYWYPYNYYGGYNSFYPYYNSYSYPYSSYGSYYYPGFSYWIW